MRNGIVKRYLSGKAFFNSHACDYSAIHIHASSACRLMILRMAKRHKIGMRILHSHSTQEGGLQINKYLHYLNRPSIKRYATHQFACSDEAAIWMFGQKDFHNNRCTIIKNGIDIDQMRCNLEIRERVRKQCSFHNKRIICHIGRFAEPKNHRFLIEIFKQIHFIQPDAILVLIGDGELRSEIEEMVQSNGLQDNVIFTGVRGDINQLLQAMDVFVMPSLYEGLPVALVEAQASGLTCIVSDKCSSEAKILDSFEYLSLQDPPQVWARRILAAPISREIDAVKKVRAAGYDIKDTASLLQRYYLIAEKDR